MELTLEETCRCLRRRKDGIALARVIEALHAGPGYRVTEVRPEEGGVRIFVACTCGCGATSEVALPFHDFSADLDGTHVMVHTHIDGEPSSTEHVYVASGKTPLRDFGL